MKKKKKSPKGGRPAVLSLGRPKKASAKTKIGRGPANRFGVRQTRKSSTKPMKKGVRYR
jgi:hypothetical protein